MAQYDESILRKIVNFSALQYSPERICQLIGFAGEEAQQLLQDLQTEGTAPYTSYQKGIAVGEYNIDVALMKASENGDVMAEATLRERQDKRRVTDLKRNLFGI